ncbi:MAG: hypothetical protein U0271_26120 [Polyangiaceae bacterium]
MRARFPGTHEAARAAFALGVMSFPSAAALALFQAYRTEAPGGALAPEALGRMMEIEHARGNDSAAAALAERYLASYPNGAHQKLARSLCARGAFAMIRAQLGFASVCAALAFATMSNAAANDQPSEAARVSRITLLSSKSEAAFAARVRAELEALGYVIVESSGITSSATVRIERKAGDLVVSVRRVSSSEPSGDANHELRLPRDADVGEGVTKVVELVRATLLPVETPQPPDTTSPEPTPKIPGETTTPTTTPTSTPEPARDPSAANEVSRSDREFAATTIARRSTPDVLEPVPAVTPDATTKRPTPTPVGGVLQFGAGAIMSPGGLPPAAQLEVRAGVWVLPWLEVLVTSWIPTAPATRAGSSTTLFSTVAGVHFRPLPNLEFLELDGGASIGFVWMRTLKSDDGQVDWVPPVGLLELGAGARVTPLVSLRADVACGATLPQTTLSLGGESVDWGLPVCMTTSSVRFRFSAD